MAGFNRQTLVTYSNVFGTKLLSPEGTLASLDKKTWAKLIARLNHLSRTRKNYNPKDLFNDWFSEKNNKSANEYWDKLVVSYTQKGVRINDLKIINIWTNLTILDKILATELGPDIEINNSDAENIFFELYLSTNEESTERSDTILKQITHEDFPEITDRFARALLTILFPHHDLNHFDPGELFIAQFIKAFYCLEFLNTNYPALLAKFLQLYGVENLNDYLLGILPIAHDAVIPGNDSGLNYLSIELSKNKAKYKIFLDHLALITGDEYPLKADFLHARSHPLFKVEEDKYLILDSVLVVNRIYNSMFFELLSIANHNIDLNLAGDKFFRVYTTEFIEQYLCYSLLDRIYEKSRYLNLSGFKIKEKFHVDTEPDYYVRNGNKIFLFEVKGSIVKGPAKQSFTFTNIEKELKEKYLFDTQKNENKAIKQLAERTKILLEQSEKAKYDPYFNPKNIRVFPILLVSEIILTTTGVNHLLNEWWQQEIENDEVLKKSASRIHDLVILDIDTLILFSLEFENSPRLIEEFILEYLHVCNKARVRSIMKAKGVNEQLLEQRITSTLESFGFFIKSKMHPRPPALYLEFARKLFPNGDA